MFAAALAIGLLLVPVETPRISHGYEAMGWSFTSSTPDGTVNFAQAALARRTKAGNPQIWMRSEYGETSASGINSARGLWEFDCENAMSRVLSLWIYTEHNLRGKVKSAEYPNAEWMAVAPDTGGANLYHLACNR